MNWFLQFRATWRESQTAAPWLLVWAGCVRYASQIRREAKESAVVTDTYIYTWKKGTTFLC